VMGLILDTERFIDRCLDLLRKEYSTISTLYVIDSVRLINSRTPGASTGTESRKYFEILLAKARETVKRSLNQSFSGPTNLLYLRDTNMALVDSIELQSWGFRSRKCMRHNPFTKCIDIYVQYRFVHVSYYVVATTSS
jgi:hypothetical protein